MAKSKDARAVLIEEAKGLLQDIARDLDIIGKGRGSDERLWCVRTTLWRIRDLVEALLDHKHGKGSDGDCVVIDPVTGDRVDPAIGNGQLRLPFKRQR